MHELIEVFEPVVVFTTGHRAEFSGVGFYSLSLVSREKNRGLQFAINRGPQSENSKAAHPRFGPFWRKVEVKAGVRGWVYARAYSPSANP